MTKLNSSILIAPILIFLLGFITLVSTYPELAKAQIIYFVLGFAVYMLISFLDYEFFRYYWKYFYFLVLFLLVLTFWMGKETFGSVRWLNLSVVSLQPSEYAKLVVVISLASVLSLKKQTFGFVKTVFLVVPVFVLVFLQPDLGTSLIIALSYIGILFYSGIDAFFLTIGFLTFGVLSAPIWNLLKDYQKTRLLVFLNPALDIKGSGYNVLQSMIAVGSGQFFGRGFGGGTQSHLKFLPVYWTDFIFAAFAEEWGFIGVIVLFILYLILLLSVLYVAYKSTDSFGSIIALGSFIILFTQFVINVGMNLGLIPVTGIPLPLVSYGGSSLISTLFLLGLVQSVWRFGNSRVS